jgi:hypothetical protein
MRLWIASFGIAAGLVLVPVACTRTTDTRTSDMRASERTDDASGVPWTKLKVVEQETDGQVRVDPEAGTITLTDDAGRSLPIAVSASVPDDFPRVVPLYPRAVTKMAGKNNPQGKPVWTVMLQTADSKEKVIAYYKANMTGFHLDGESPPAAGPTYGSRYESPQYDVTVMLLPGASDQRTITLTVLTK